MTRGPDFTGLIELASGRFLDIMNPSTDDIVIGDVAHGLSLSCRFSGQCCHFYSVAEHTLLVSRRLRDEGYGPLEQLAGLHHDDAESFITDIPRPFKPHIPGYHLIEDSVLAAILEALGTPSLPVHDALVKSADQWALAQEAGELMPSTGKHWYLGHDWDGEDRNLGMQPERVRTKWLRRHRYLTSLLEES